ncbi:ABC transporter substrate-binding protein [Kribbella solani]|uniref:ABC-type transport system substrate-binding protein n=1 Tax=Kribbella solani TaxID=236067 RepID=A0A841E461_9ACTN|nr:ABC transporter substrate-binding protein [Kribbella solani]MBB5983730.1 ABC-type transport system substrate-binding protein [Kribbella solani]
MMPKPYLRLLTALAAVLALSSCSAGNAAESSGPASAPVRGGELTVLRAADVDSWDPDKALMPSTFETLPQVMEGLVRPSADGATVVPGLAQKWVFDAGHRTLTFTLRPNLRFSNGATLTSADVAFSVKLWQQSVSYGTLYSAIQSASTPNATTVVLKLHRPSTFLLSWLGNGTAVVVPKGFGGKSRADFFRKPIGAGPFVIDSYTPGQTLRLARNSHYYGEGRPYLDAITYKVVSDPNQQLLQYQSGQADMLESVPLDVSAQLPAADRHLVKPSSTIHAAFVNTTKGPGTDLHFRRAISYAIDRDSYIKSVFSGLATPAKGGLPIGVQGSSACDCTYRYDQAAAKAELSRSGYDGSPVVLLVDASSPISTRGGEVAAQMLRAVGIKVDLQPEEGQVMFDRYSKGDYGIELAEVASVSPSVGDIFGLVSYMVTGSDPGKVISGAFDKLDVARTEPERQHATKLAENWIGEHLPYVPIAYPDRVLAAAPKLHGLQVTPYLNYPADQLWIG